MLLIAGPPVLRSSKTSSNIAVAASLMLTVAPSITVLDLMEDLKTSSELPPETWIAPDSVP